MSDLDDMVNDLDGQENDAEWRRRADGKLKPLKNPEDEKAHQEIQAAKKKGEAKAASAAVTATRNDERRLKGKLKKLDLTEGELDRVLKWKKEREVARQKKTDKASSDRAKLAKENIEADLEDEAEDNPGIKFRVLDIRGPDGEAVMPFWQRKKIREGTDNGGRKRTG